MISISCILSEQEFRSCLIRHFKSWFLDPCSTTKLTHFTRVRSLQGHRPDVRSTRHLRDLTGPHRLRQSERRHSTRRCTRVQRQRVRPHLSPSRFRPPQSLTAHHIRMWQPLTPQLTVCPPFSSSKTAQSPAPSAAPTPTPSAQPSWPHPPTPRNPQPRPHPAAAPVPASRAVVAACSALAVHQSPAAAACWRVLGSSLVVEVEGRT